MIKNYLFLFICILSLSKIIAQTPELVLELSLPGDIVIHNNELFIARENRISKINLNDISPSITDYFIGTSPEDLLVSNNYMYVADTNLGKVYKTDLTIQPYTTTDIIISSQPIGLAINGNDLYIHDNSFPQKIFKQDVSTITNPTFIEFTEEFINDLIFEAYGMIIYNNELYLGQTDPDLIAITVSKISTATSPATTLPMAITGWLNSIPRKFAIKDNYLYIAQIDKIIKIDLTDSQPISYSIVTTDVNNPKGIAIDGCNLYISDNLNNRITKLNICSLSTNQNNIKPISLYPNPSKNKIAVSGLTGIEKYKIYSTVGILVDEGIISNNENIDIHNLAKNMYFLNFENGSTIKFIKE